MGNTADIRRENLNLLRRCLWAGGEHTKQSLSQATGLSVATCNTLLNALEEQGEVIGAKRRINDVGRSSMAYCINEAKDWILCIHGDLIQGVQVLTWVVMTLTGCIIAESRMQPHDRIDKALIESTIRRLLAQYPAIRQIMLGVPGAIKDGMILLCDLPSLDGCALADDLQKAFLLPVHMENDMHYRIYGYARAHAADTDVLTLCYWTLGVYPGVATFHKGTHITGHNLFAGFMGFFPYPMEKEELFDKLRSPKTAQPIVDSVIASLIAMLNPSVLVLSGDYFTAASLPHLREACLRTIPEAFMPKLLYVEDTEPEYLSGMHQRALDLKCTL